MEFLVNFVYFATVQANLLRFPTYLPFCIFYLFIAAIYKGTFFAVDIFWA